MANSSGNGKTPDRMAHWPDEVRDQVRGRLSDDKIEACSRYDLNASGRYASGYVVLGAGLIGHFSKPDSQWRVEWLDVSKLQEARVVEGLGMSLLRLVGGGVVLHEFRFTNRHAKPMAELHAVIERQISGAEVDDKSRRDHGGRGGPGDTKQAVCEKCGNAIPDWAETCPRCLQQRKVLMRLVEFVRPHKWRALGGFGLAVLALGTDLAQPLLTKWALDLAIGKRDVSMLTLLVTLMGLAVVVTSFANAFRGRLMGVMGMKVAAEIRDRCYSHLHKLSLSYYSRKSTGSLITRVTSDSDRIWDFVAFNLVEVVVGFLTFVGVGLIMFFINWRLAMLALVPLPLLVLMVTFFHRRMHRVFRRMWHRWSAMTAVVADAIPGMRVIKAFNQEQREVERFHHRNYRVYSAQKEMVGIMTLFGPATRMASHIGFIIIWAVGGYWAIRDLAAVRAADAAGMSPAAGLMTIGGLVAFNGLMWRFFQPVHMVAHMSRMFNRAATSAQRILEVLDTEPEIYSRHDAKPLEKLEGRIEFRNVSFSYDGVRRVLKNLSFAIDPGEMIGLVGHSGSGKTTLVNLVCRFYDPLEGQILLDGTDLRDYQVEDIRRKIGVVLQEPYLFRGTIAENIAYGNPEADILHVIEAARAANVHDVIVGFPDGYDTTVGERGHTLSGGERQRVSIARAILNNPPLLILDEATSSVDTKTEKQIQEALDRLVANRTTIAIAHRLSTLQKAERLVILDKGKIVEVGTHSELEAKKDGVYAGLLKIQSEMKSVVALNE